MRLLLIQLQFVQEKEARMPNTPVDEFIQMVKTEVDTKEK